MLARLTGTPFIYVRLNGNRTDSCAYRGIWPLRRR